MALTWSNLLLLAGAIVTLGAAVRVMDEWISRIVKPSKRQDERLDKLEDALEKDKAALSHLEDTTAITLRALLALLTHGINGNDITALEQSKSELTEYLTGRK